MNRLASIFSSGRPALACSARSVMAAGALTALAVLASPGLAEQEFASKITPVWSADAERWENMHSDMENAVKAQFASRSSYFEVLSLNPQLPPAGQPYGKSPESWRSVVYDYQAETAHELILDAAGNVLETKPLESPVFMNQPPPSEREFQSAVDSLYAHPVYGPALIRGSAEVYEAMPPVDYTPGAPRTLHVGLRPTDDSFDHVIAGVVMRTGEVKVFRSGAPAQAQASNRTCGPSSAGGCTSDTSGSGVISVQWPEINPVWTMDVVRPDATETAETPNGTGIELRNVRYNGELILLTAHVPVLNVKYDGDSCGPFRDWLDQEACFDVTGGSIVAPGFYRTTDELATICVDGTDDGNFRGVGIQDTPTALVMVSEMAAGWYRYLVGWRFEDDGDIVADFFYAGTFNSCTCEPRTHHAYWRFDFALGGVADGGAPGGFAANNVFQQRSNPDPDPWVSRTVEDTFVRTILDGSESEFRVLNPDTNIAYEFIANKLDGTADGDPYGQSDLWLLAWDPNEVDDDPGFTSAIGLDNYYVSSPETVTNERLVVWYGGHLRQDGGMTGGSNTCAAFGPRINRVDLSVPVTLNAFGLE